MMVRLPPFETVRAAALEVLTNHSADLGWHTGGFLGQCCVASRPLTQKQRDWLSTILDRAGLPPLTETAE